MASVNIGATTMGTGGDKAPQLLVITFSKMHEICMKHARCIVMRQRSMQYRPISFDTFVILGNELHASALWHDITDTALQHGIERGGPRWSNDSEHAVTCWAAVAG